MLGFLFLCKIVSLEVLMMNEKQWRTKIAEGKWTIAEIIGHFIPWDMFVLQHRIPYFFSNEPLPKGLEAARLNVDSAAQAREHTKEMTIGQFIAGRERLVAAIKEISNDAWQKELVIGQITLSVSAYFRELAEHDLHHFIQINNALLNDK